MTDITKSKGSSRKGTICRIGITLAGVFTFTFVALPAAAASQTNAPVFSPHSYSTCKGAQGPGAVNKHCIDVVGNSLRVDSVKGELISTNFLPAPIPAEICGVTVSVWGTLLGGAHWEKTAQTNECGLGALGFTWAVGQDFQPGSFICARTSYNGYQPEPVCVQISY